MFFYQEAKYFLTVKILFSTQDISCVQMYFSKNYLHVVVKLYVKVRHFRAIETWMSCIFWESTILRNWSLLPSCYFAWVFKFYSSTNQIICILKFILVGIRKTHYFELNLFIKLKMICQIFINLKFQFIVPCSSKTNPQLL